MKQLVFILPFAILLSNCQQNDAVPASNLLSGTTWKFAETKITGCASTKDTTYICNSSCQTMVFTPNTWITKDSKGNVLDDGYYLIIGDSINLGVNDPRTTVRLRETDKVSGDTLSMTFHNPFSGCTTSYLWVLVKR